MNVEDGPMGYGNALFFLEKKKTTIKFVQDSIMWRNQRLRLQTFFKIKSNILDGNIHSYTEEVQNERKLLHSVTRNNVSSFF